MAEINRRTTLTILGGTLLGGSLLSGSMAGASAAQAVVPSKSAPSKLASVWTREGTIRRAGGSIHYAIIDTAATAGNAALPPVVLLHKLGGWVSDWRHIAAALPGRQVIALDLPGHGGSVMDGEPPYLQTLPETAALLKATLEELGVERFALIGNSLGGCVSTVISALWPDAVTRLALIGVSLIPGTTRAEMIQNLKDKPPTDFTADGLPIPRTLEQTKRFGTYDPQINDEMNQSRAKAGRWLGASMRGVMLTPFHEHLARIKAPVILINGERADYRKYEEFASKHTPNIRIETIKNSGAFTHQEQPAETIRLLKLFLTA